MSNPTPNITAPVDLTNPGQFFACCGLLELADRLWPGVEGWFNSGGSFALRSEHPECKTLALLKQLSVAEVKMIDPSEPAASPMRLHLGGQPVLLNWWCDTTSGGSRLKTWAGRQCGHLIFSLMVKRVGSADPADPFGHSAQVFDKTKAGKDKDKTISPFYFDARRAGKSLDFGFSPDTQRMSIPEYPVVEALAMVGLQRCRPRIDESTTPMSFIYTAWSQPLGALALTGVACGMVQVPAMGNFRFTRPSRGGDYTNMFTRAKRERSSNA